MFRKPEAWWRVKLQQRDNDPWEQDHLARTPTEAAEKAKRHLARDVLILEVSPHPTLGGESEQEEPG